MGGFAIRFPDYDAAATVAATVSKEQEVQQEQQQPAPSPPHTEIVIDPNGRRETDSAGSTEEASRYERSDVTTSWNIWKLRRPPASGMEYFHHEAWTKFLATSDVMSRRYGKLTWKPHDAHSSLAVQMIRHAPWGPGNGPLYDIVAFQGNVWSVNAVQLAVARRFGIIARLPLCIEDEISDKNKGDSFVKLLAVLQVIWLVVQLIVRKAGGLPSSALEIATLAFASIAFLLCLLQWPKAQDVNVPLYVHGSRSPGLDEFESIVVARSWKMFGFSEMTYAISNQSLAADLYEE